MRLWIDDIRPAPKGWVWVKDSKSAIDVIANTPNIEIISYDHDLGSDDTTRRVILWQCENNVWPALAQIHSQNSVGVDYLQGMMLRYGNIPVRIVNYRENL